jgi:hypothetical protein
MTSSLTPSSRGGGWKHWPWTSGRDWRPTPARGALMIAGSMDGPHALALGERLLDLFADAGLSPPTARAGHLLIAFGSDRSPWSSPTWAKSSRPQRDQNVSIAELVSSMRAAAAGWPPPQH